MDNTSFAENTRVYDEKEQAQGIGAVDKETEGAGETFLSGFINTIAKWEPNELTGEMTEPPLYDPSAKMNKDDKVLGVIRSPWVKRIYTLYIAATRKVAEQEVFVKFATPAETEEAGIRLERFQSEADLLRQLAWHAMRSEIPGFPCCIELREGWKMIEGEHSSHGSLAEILTNAIKNSKTIKLGSF